MFENEQNKTVVHHERWRAESEFSTNNRRRKGKSSKKNDISNLKDKIEVHNIW